MGDGLSIVDELREAPEEGSHPLFDLLRGTLAVLVVVVPVVWVLDLPRLLLGLELYNEQLLAFELALVIPLAYLTLNATRHKVVKPALVDIALAAIGLAAGLYLTLDYENLLNESGFMPTDGVIVGSIIIALSTEGVRRSTGWALAIVVLLFLLYAYFGHLLPQAYSSREISLPRMAVYLGIDTNALLGPALNVATTVIVPFILLGRLLTAAGGSEFFTCLAMGAMGRYRGGSAKIAVVASCLFGTISGAAVANVAGIGVVTIPLMKRGGYPAPVAGAVEAVASTGGQLMPPVMGASAFLMAEYLAIPYSEVMMAALLPILLYYIAIFIHVDLLAAKLNIAGVPRSEIPKVTPELKEGWHFALPFVLFVVLLARFNMQPEVAVLYSAAALVATSMIFGYKGRRISIKAIGIAVKETGEAAFDLVLLTAAAGLVIGVLNLTGVAFSMSIQMAALAGDSVALLMIVAAVASIVLGMGMPTVGVYVLLATLIAPAMVEAGVEPVAAHMFVLYFGMLSMVTPPIAIAAFTAANLAQASPWATANASVKLGWTAYIVPFLFVMSPSLLLIGPLGSSLQVACTAIIGVALITAAIVGYAKGRIGFLSRILSGLAGLALILPGNAFAGAIYIDIAGGVLALLLGLKFFVVDPRRERALDGRCGVMSPDPEPFAKYHKDGTLRARGQSLDGKPTGYWEWFRKDGTRLRSGHFEDGKQVGDWITYDKDGEVYKVTVMKPQVER